MQQPRHCNDSEACFDHVRLYIPMNLMSLHILDPDLNLLKFVASVGPGLPLVSEEIVSLPEEGRNERAVLLKKGEVIRIVNRPDAKLGLPEIAESIDG